MKKFQGLLNEQSARNMAGLVKWVCYFVVAFTVLGMALSFLGRQTFILHTNTGTYEHASFSAASNGWMHQGMMTSSRGVVQIHAYADGEINFITRAALSVAYVAFIIPLMLSFWFLGRLFKNINKGQIFVHQNAYFLLYFGLLQIMIALIIPFIQLAIFGLANMFTVSRITYLYNANLFSNALLPIVCIVAAYIIHYGVSLQDEVNHTI